VCDSNEIHSQELIEQIKQRKNTLPNTSKLIRVFADTFERKVQNIGKILEQYIITSLTIYPAGDRIRVNRVDVDPQWVQKYNQLIPKNMKRGQNVAELMDRLYDLQRNNPGNPNIVGLLRNEVNNFMRQIKNQQSGLS
jgi:malate synthase